MIILQQMKSWPQQINVKYINKQKGEQRYEWKDTKYIVESICQLTSPYI